MDRRQFLKGLAAGLILPLTRLPAKPPTTYVFSALNWDPHLGKPVAYKTKGQTSFVCYSDLHETYGSVPLPFTAHTLLAHPRNPERLIGMSKRRPAAAEFEWRTGKITRSIEAIGNGDFYGHGLFTSDGKTLLLSEVKRGSRRGFLSVRSVDDYRLLSELETHGDAPHEFAFSADNKMLFVCNFGSAEGNGCLTAIELASGRLVEKWISPVAQQEISHLKFAADGTLVVLSRPGEKRRDQRGGIFLLKKSGRLVPVTGAEVPLGDALSVAISESKRVFAVTHTFADKVTFWNLSDGRHLASLSIPRPQGVLFDDKGVLHLTTESGALHTVETTNYQITNTVFRWGQAGNDAHLWPIPT